MIQTTLLPALLAMAAPEPLTLPSYPAIEPSLLLTPRADDDADVFSYSYIEVGATRYEVDYLDDEADTYYGEVSLELFKFLNIFLGYENQSFDFDNLDSDIWSLGAGVHFSVAPKLDLTADLAWLVNSLDGDTIDDDTDSFQLRAGARWMLLHSAALGLEVFGRGVALSQDENIDDIDVDADNTLLGFDVGVRAHIVGRFSIAVEYSDLEDSDQVGLSARFSF